VLSLVQAVLTIAVINVLICFIWIRFSCKEGCMKQVRQIRVWDLPVRLFHWTLVFGVLSAWITADFLEVFDVHEMVGLLVIGLVVFRVMWGLWGSSTARFSQFVRGKEAAMDYLSGRWQGVGHNPIGGWSVLLMLGLLLLMGLTGLFANNDGDYTGPLAFWVNTDVSGFLTSIHKLAFNLLLLVIGVHVLAIVIYKRVLGKDLIKPMIVGDADAETDSQASTEGGSWMGFVLALMVALAAVWAASGAWHSPAEKPVVSNPDW